MPLWQNTIHMEPKYKLTTISRKYLGPTMSTTKISVPKTSRACNKILTKRESWTPPARYLQTWQLLVDFSKILVGIWAPSKRPVTLWGRMLRLQVATTRTTPKPSNKEALAKCLKACFHRTPLESSREQTQELEPDSTTAHWTSCPRMALWPLNNANNFKLPAT